jgi:peptidyl-prolyl cis-trans isomerase C
MGEDLSGRAAAPLVPALLAALVLAGCEQVPWWPWPRAQGGSGGAASTASAQAPAVPGRPMVLPEDVVAKVNGVPISVADASARVEELKTLVTNLGQEWKPLEQDQLEGLVDELVRAEVLSQDAVSRNRHLNSEVQRRWEALRRTFFSQEWLAEQRDQITVEASDVEQFYGQNKLGFREPQRRRLRQLTVGSDDEAKRALARLLDGSAEFEALARQISVAPTAKDGGLIATWVMRAQEKALRFGSEAEAEAAGVSSLDPALEAAAFAIDQVKGLSNYVKGADNRYHIFQLTDRQEERQIPLAEVYDRIKDLLTVQRLQEKVDALEKAATIERFPERLDRLSQ